MKKILVLGIALCLQSSCSTPIYLDKETVKKTVDSSRGFVFVARRAIPTNSDISNLMIGLPQTSGAHLMDLDQGYSIEVHQKELICYLPYFGRRYTANMDPLSNGFKFVSKSFAIHRKEGKRKREILVIRPYDVQNIQEIIMEIFPNGRIITSVSASDRQPISYDGFMEVLPYKSEGNTTSL